MVSPLARVAREAGAILGLTLVWALAWNALDPQGVALGAPLPARATTDPSYLDHAAVESLWRVSPATRFVDVRNVAAWNQGRLPGALHLPANRFDDAWATVGPRLRETDDVILYCDGPHCPLAATTRDRLAGMGFTRLRIYEGGWAAWYASGLPREAEDR